MFCVLICSVLRVLFVFADTATPEIYTYDTLFLDTTLFRSRVHPDGADAEGERRRVRLVDIFGEDRGGEAERHVVRERGGLVSVVERNDGDEIGRAHV